MRKLWQHGDRLWRAVLVAMALLVLGLVVAVGMMLWQESTAAREAFGVEFLQPTADVTWNRVTDAYQAWPFIYGTLLTALVGAIVLLWILRLLKR